MGDVVSFEKPKQEQMVLICGECGCKSFYFYASGNIECCNCDNLVKMNDGTDMTQWMRCAPDVPDNIPTVPEEGSGNLSVKVLGNAVFARKSVMKKVKEWGEDLVAVFAYHRDGSGSHWNGVETAEQRDWLLRKIDGVTDHLKKTEYSQ